MFFIMAMCAIVGSLGMVLAGGRMISEGGTANTVGGLLGVSFFGLGFGVLVDRRIRRTRLVLTHDAIQKRVFGSRVIAQIPYRNIAEIGITEDPDNYCVSVTLCDKSDPSTVWPKPHVLQYRQDIEGWDLLIASSFLIDQDSLANKIRKRLRNRQA